MKRMFYWLPVAMIALSLTATSCGDDSEDPKPDPQPAQQEEPQKPEDNKEKENPPEEQKNEDKDKDKDGNVAKAIVEVGYVYDDDEETLYYDAVAGTRVYMFKLDVWDSFTEEVDLSQATVVITDENGFATFDIKEDTFNESQNYVFAVQNEDGDLVSNEVTLKKGKIAELTVFQTGEESGGAKFSNLIKTYKLEHLMAQAHLVAGGGIFKSDEVIQSIELPANVVQWYYSFSCNAVDNSELILGLYESLKPMFSVTAGLPSDAISKLVKPNGTETCDIYLLDEENYQKYINGGTAKSLKKNQGLKSGIISEYRYTEQEKYYLMIKNTSFQRMAVELEIVALTEE